jgi:hypothetical protein
VRRLTVLLFTVLLAACSEQAVPAQPPAQKVAERPPSEVPDDWWLDAPLKAERVGECQPGNILSEKLYWSRRPIIVKLHVLLESGRQTVRVMPSGDSSSLVREASEHVRRCVERTRFVAPPRYPYEFEATVHLKPARGAT